MHSYRESRSLLNPHWWHIQLTYVVESNKEFPLRLHSIPTLRLSASSAKGGDWSWASSTERRRTSVTWWWVWFWSLYRKKMQISSRFWTLQNRLKRVRGNQRCRFQRSRKKLTWNTRRRYDRSCGRSWGSSWPIRVPPGWCSGSNTSKIDLGLQKMDGDDYLQIDLDQKT